MTSRRIHRLITSAVVAASLALGLGALSMPSASASASTAVVEPAAAPSRTIATTQPSKIVITRVNASDSVRLTWPKHAKATRYLVIASSDGDGIASATTRSTSATISRLDPAIRYTFIVTPMSARASAKSMRAVMAQPLRGASPATGTPSTTGVDATASPSTGSASTGLSGSKGSSDDKGSSSGSVSTGSTGTGSSNTGSTAPRTTTVWECPEGYADAGSDCVKTRAYTTHQETTAVPYTYHDVVTTTAYTYHSEFIETGVRFIGVARNVHGECVSPGRAYPEGCGYYEHLGHTISVKDATPAGFTDDGTAWTRTDQVKDATPAGFTDDGAEWTKTEQVKDATPAGFTDDGTQWVTRTAKVARQVPA